MERDSSQAQPGAAQETVRGSRRPPPPPQAYDSQSPTTPNSSKALPSIPGELMSTSPTSLASQSPPSYGQLWRRRSVKSDKTLSVSELKLTSSHGSTAASSQQPASSPAQDSSLSNPLPSFSGLDQDSPILKDDSNPALPGHIIRPSASNQSLHRNHPPPTEFQGNKESQDHLDGFSQYAQEVENGFANNSNNNNNNNNNSGTYYYKAAAAAGADNIPSTPTRSPEIRRLPTPEYEDDEDRDYVAAAVAAENTAMLSPASPVFPITPPSDGRPLSMIPEGFVKNTSRSANSAAIAATTTAAAATAAATAAYPPPSGPLPALPPRTSSRLSPSSAAAAPAAPRSGLPRRPVSADRAAPVAAASVYGSRPGGSSLASSLEISEYGASWASSPPAATGTTTAAAATTNNNHNNDNYSDDYAPISPDPNPGPNPGPVPDDTTYSPTPEYSRVFLPGDTIPAPPLRETQLDCFGGHAVLTPSRNESHPVGCMACLVQDRGARFTCSHCSARVCLACRDGLVGNGRDLRGWVRGLRG
ncbi:hypothetical protein VMCG_07109 [Cytospora schulzeri]|uniref:Uncharacterized protein n=1 Tax=Cytospora schulzeri TaxID=448051 RepID=A0A423W528_9PEZI|nr:hypothetical protein VMCG_07109 [Valsa malicola]